MLGRICRDYIGHLCFVEVISLSHISWIEHHAGAFHCLALIVVQDQSELLIVLLDQLVFIQALRPSVDIHCELCVRIVGRQQCVFVNCQSRLVEMPIKREPKWRFLVRFHHLIEVQELEIGPAPVLCITCSALALERDLEVRDLRLFTTRHVFFNMQCDVFFIS